MNKLILIALLFASCAKKPNPPAPTPTPEPTPPAVVTCDNQAIGALKDLGCPAGQVGQAIQVCRNTGAWEPVINTCALPPPAPVTCDGDTLGTTQKIDCPQGQVGDHYQVCTGKGWSNVVDTCQSPPTPPTPPPAPIAVDLPYIYRTHKDYTIAIAVRAQPKVKFVWSTGEVGEKIWLKADKDKFVTVQALGADGGKGSAVTAIVVEKAVQ